MSETKIVVIYGNSAGRWLSSALSIAMITAMSVANHRWGGGSTWIDAIAAVLGFAALISMSASLMKTGNYSGTRKQVIEHLQNMND